MDNRDRGLRGVLSKSRTGRLPRFRRAGVPKDSGPDPWIQKRGSKRVDAEHVTSKSTSGETVLVLGDDGPAGIQKPESYCAESRLETECGTVHAYRASISMTIDPKKIRKILVRAPNWLGDVIMATPSFARIRSAFIDAEIVCGIKPGHQAILDGSRSFDGYLPMKGQKGRKAFFEDVRRLRERDFDLVVLFPNSVSSALMCLMAGVPYMMMHGH